MMEETPIDAEESVRVCVCQRGQMLIIYWYSGHTFLLWTTRVVLYVMVTFLYTSLK